MYLEFHKFPAIPYDSNLSIWTLYIVLLWSYIVIYNLQGTVTLDTLLTGLYDINNV
jgi:hypothetical protein